MRRLLLLSSLVSPLAMFTACGSSTNEIAASSSAGGAASSSASIATASGTGGASASTATTTSSASSTSSGGGTPSMITVGGDRPATVHVPPTYTPGTPMPLLVMLHGYSASGAVEELYLDLLPQSDAKGFLYVYPDGTVDSMGQRFWNASDACCNFYGSTVDDEGYLMGLVDEIGSKLTVDPKRVYFMGHSNGGFMTYRMACHHADRIAAIAVLAGEMPADLSTCKPTADVALLHIQGTADATIAYNGGSVAAGVPAYPSAATSVADWVGFDACDSAADTTAAPLDLESTLDGAETTVTQYHGCAKGTDVALWSIQGGSHIPTFQPAFGPDMTSWLLAHAKQ